MSSERNNSILIYRVLFIWALFFVTLQYNLAQETFTTLDTADYPQRLLAVKKYRASVERYKKLLLDNKKSKVKKILEAETDEFNQSMIDKILAGDYTFDKRFVNYTNKIISNLAESNPSLKGNYNILIAKDGSLNAYCLSDGTFIINMGLFYWLDNQDQMASIIAHEIGHKVLRHGHDAHIAQVEDLFSKDTKRSIREVKKSHYGKNEKAQQVIKEKLYARGNENRLKELQADSIGYEFLKNTAYEKQSFIRALKIGQLYDTLKPTGLLDTTYELIFSTPDLSFRQDWLVQEDFSDYNYGQNEEILSEDSLATHPETKRRVKYLKSLYPHLEKDDKEVIPDSTFLILQKLASNERIPNLYYQDVVGGGIFLCLLRLQRKPNDAYHRLLLGKGLTGIYKARKAYKLNRYLDVVSPEHQSKTYQRFLNFMWNLKLEDLKAFADYYDPK